jgi:hypothetical protein
MERTHREAQSSWSNAQFRLVSAGLRFTAWTSVVIVVGARLAQAGATNNRRVVLSVEGLRR